MTKVTANDRLKESFPSWFWGCMISATLIHLGALASWPEFTMRNFSDAPEALEAIQIPPEIELPPPPQRIERPAEPVTALADIEAEVTIVPPTFEEFPFSTLPPPERGTTGHDRMRFITAFSVAPEIQNQDEVVRAMRREYPPLLRDAGIRGTVRVYFFVDENGRVQDTRIDRSSGHQALDRAALAVAKTYRFSPALLLDRPIPLWVSIPITFQVR